MSIGQSGGRQNVKPAVTSCLVKAEMSQVKSSQVYDFYVHLWQAPHTFFWSWVKPLKAVQKPMLNESWETIKGKDIK